MKFKEKRILALTLFLAAGLAACGGTAAQGQEAAAFTVESRLVEAADDFGSLTLELPSVSGISGAGDFNAAVLAAEEQARAEFDEAAAQRKSAGEAGESGWEQLPELYLSASYTILESGDLRSVLIRWENYLGGAHGYEWLQPLTVSAASGELLGFSDLFQSRAGVEYVSEKIRAAVAAEPEAYAATAEDTLTALDGEYAYLINGDRITVYFKTYDLAAYAAGEQFFEFPAQELKSYLKKEVYESIRDQSAAAPETLFAPLN